MSDEYYFSDRERGPRNRVESEIGNSVWGGIAVIIRKALSDHYFAQSFPEQCPDHPDSIGYTDKKAFHSAYRSVIQDAPSDIDPELVAPPTLAVLDLVEFCYGHIAKPVPNNFYYCRERERHHLVDFDRGAGQAEYRDNINRIFARNGLGYQLRDDGRIVRLAPPVLDEVLMGAIFNTGDPELDGKLNDARRKFLSRDSNERRQALESLWDAFERLKTTEDTDKKQSIKKLLQKASPEENFRRQLDEEAVALTNVGNDFTIRHWETTKISITDSEHIDYLFQRMFALVYLLLRKKGAVR